MDDKIVTLEGRDVLTLSIDPTQQMTKPGAGSTSEPRPYYRARYAGKVFTVDEKVFADFVAGNIAQLTIAANEYEVDDPENPDAKLKRIGWAFSGYATYDQIQNIESKQGTLAMGRKRFEVETKKMDIELIKLEKEALATVVLDDKKVAELTTAL